MFRAGGISEKGKGDFAEVRSGGWGAQNTSSQFQPFGKFPVKVQCILSKRSGPVGCRFRRSLHPNGTLIAACRPSRHDTCLQLVRADDIP